MINEKKSPTDYVYRSAIVDLERGQITFEEKSCQDLEDFLGGIGRIFKFMSKYNITDAYDPSAPLVMEIGRLTGTNVMTGLRTYFGGYSPLKGTLAGAPSVMWTAGSGKFGYKMASTGLDEVVFIGRSFEPVILVMRSEVPGCSPSLELSDATFLLGKDTHEKIMTLKDRYEDAHFAVIGPPGENYQANRMAAIALSTVNQLRTRESKPRFCGRGGFGGVMGSKNLIAIVAQAPDRKMGVSEVVREINWEVARGKGSKNYRDRMGGTWRNVGVLHPLGCLPEHNFNPTGTQEAKSLYRQSYEEPYLVKSESCFKCGIGCHKNIYERPEDTTAQDRRSQKGRFRTKFDYEPLDILAPNCGIYDQEEALQIVELVDRMGFDAISLGATISYAMEYNERHPDKPILDNIRFGEFDKMVEIIKATAAGNCNQIGQGSMRLALELGELSYAMQGKGLEYPAYLPETNPGYPWAIAGGHVSFRTHLLLVNDGQRTDMEYWQMAIRNGFYDTRDDMIGLCKFGRTPLDIVVASLNEMYGLSLTDEEVRGAVRRTYLRGYLLEKKVGYTKEEYDLPARVFDRKNDNVKMPHFITRPFMDELREGTMRYWEECIEKEGISITP